MRKKRLLSFILLAAVVTFSVVYFMTHREEFQLLNSFSLQAVIVLLALELLMILCLGLQVKVLTDHYQLGLSFVQWFGLARMTSLANLMFGFAAGTSVKAVYLKRFHNLNYGSLVAATGIAGIIKLMVGGLFATALLLMLGQTENLMLPLASVITLATLLFLSLAHRVPHRFFSFWSVISDLVNEWGRIRQDRKMMMKLFFLSIVLFLIYSLEIYFAFAAFGVTASFSASAVITAFDNLAGAVKLIPGNIGIKEAIFGMISAVYGIGINEGVHAAVLHRVVRTAVSLLVGAGFTYQLIRSYDKADTATASQNTRSRLVT